MIMQRNKLQIQRLFYNSLKISKTRLLSLMQKDYRFNYAADSLVTKHLTINHSGQHVKLTKKIKERSRTRDTFNFILVHPSSRATSISFALQEKKFH